jgi:hypothetical protein
MEASTMKLECEGRIASADATEADIRNALADDDGRGEFIILSQADEVYLQASGEADGPFVIEYRDGGEDRHFECTRDVSKSEVETVFFKYLKNDPTWRTDLEWKPLEMKSKKPWWKLW